MIGIIGGETWLETRESLRKLGSNLAVPLSGESGQWGWQRTISMEGQEGENSDLPKLEEGEGELVEQGEGGGGVGAGRWVAILSNLPTLSSGGLST